MKPNTPSHQTSSATWALSQLTEAKGSENARQEAVWEVAHASREAQVSLPQVSMPGGSSGAGYNAYLNPGTYRTPYGTPDGSVPGFPNYGTGGQPGYGAGPAMGMTGVPPMIPGAGASGFSPAAFGSYPGGFGQPGYGATPQPAVLVEQSQGDPQRMGQLIASAEIPQALTGHLWQLFYQRWPQGSSTPASKNQYPRHEKMPYGGWITYFSPTAYVETPEGMNPNDNPMVARMYQQMVQRGQMRSQQYASEAQTDANATQSALTRLDQMAAQSGLYKNPNGWGYTSRTPAEQQIDARLQAYRANPVSNRAMQETTAWEAFERQHPELDRTTSPSGGTAAQVAYQQRQQALIEQFHQGFNASHPLPKDHNLSS